MARNSEFVIYRVFKAEDPLSAEQAIIQGGDWPNVDKKIALLILFVLAALMLVAACAPAPTPAPTAAPKPTEAAKPTEAVTPTAKA